MPHNACLRPPTLEPPSPKPQIPKADHNEHTGLCCPSVMQGAEVLESQAPPNGINVGKSVHELMVPAECHDKGEGANCNHLTDVNRPPNK